MKRRAAAVKQRKYTVKNIKKDFRRNWRSYLLVLPVIAFFIIFNYIPMGGIVLAFCDFKPKLGLFGSFTQKFIGFKHFENFFQSIFFGRLIRNTLLLNLLDLAIAFPLTIIAALLINELKDNWFKKSVQTISYMPYFISMVVVCGIIVDFCKSTGVLGTLVSAITGKTQNLLGVKEYWRPIYIGSGLWQSLGFGTIIYIAALSGVDQQLYEAAELDGAGYMKRMWHVTLPGISPTIIIMLIMRVGALMSSMADKTILMYNAQIYETADVIASYVYRKGIQEGGYSFSTAVGLFNSVVNLVLLVFANKISRTYSETSLF